MSPTLKIAVASSGLGHIRRGVETWAEQLGCALRKAGYNAYVFQGAGASHSTWRCTLPCLRRFSPTAQRIANVLQRCGGWRIGLGSGYEVEQSTFTASLWSRVRRDFDILHVKDPQVALWMDRLNRLGLSKPRVIISHGTEEDVCTLQHYSYLQHMAPWYWEQYKPHRPRRQLNFVVPNFIDTSQFKPEDRIAARLRWGIPLSRTVYLCVSAIKKVHKRIDYLIREFAAFLQTSQHPAALVIAGAREKETDELLALGRTLCAGNVTFLESVSRSEIPSLYHAADAFVLTSLSEMFGNVFLEALACELPIICNETPVSKWVVGPAGNFIDMSRPGALAEAFHKLCIAAERERLARQARPHVEANFSEPVVLRQVLNMYEQVVAPAQ